MSVRRVLLVLAVLANSNLLAGILEFGEQLCDPFERLHTADQNKTITTLVPYGTDSGSALFVGYGRVSGGRDVDFIYFDPIEDKMQLFFKGKAREEALDKYYNIEGTLYCPGNHVNSDPPIYPVYRLTPGQDPQDDDNWDIKEVSSRLNHKKFYGTLGGELWVTGNDHFPSSLIMVYNSSSGSWDESYYDAADGGVINELLEFSVGQDDYIYAIGGGSGSDAPQLLRKLDGATVWELLDDIFTPSPYYFYKACAFKDSIYIVTHPDGSFGDLWCTDGETTGYKEPLFSDHDAIRVFDIGVTGQGGNERLYVLAWLMKDEGGTAVFDEGCFYTTYDGCHWCGPKRYSATLTGGTEQVPFTAYSFMDERLYGGMGRSTGGNPFDESGLWRSGVISDFDPPQIETAMHIIGRRVRVTFNEPVDKDTGEDVENYSLKTPFGFDIEIDRVIRSETEHDVVNVITVDPLPSGIYKVSVCCVEDLSWNSAKYQEAQFRAEDRQGPEHKPRLEANSSEPADLTMASELQIYDLAGRLIHQFRADQGLDGNAHGTGDLRAALPHLQTGVYFVAATDSRPRFMVVQLPGTEPVCLSIAK